MDNNNTKMQQELERLFEMMLNGSLLELEENLLDFNEEEMHARAEYLATSLVETLSEEEEAIAAVERDVESWAEFFRDWILEWDEEVAHHVVEDDLMLKTMAENLLLMVMMDGPTSRFEVGDHVLAVMEQDKEWHPATVMGMTEQSIEVRFKQFGNPQTMKVDSEDIVIDKSYLLEHLGDNNCQICQRDSLPLTFHHLIPRETHSQLLKKSKFPPSIADIYDPSVARKEWLNSHGIMICRPCHSHVHRSESNDVLALKYNRLEWILMHPKIKKWKAYACKR